MEDEIVGDGETYIDRQSPEGKNRRVLAVRQQAWETGIRYQGKGAMRGNEKAGDGREYQKRIAGNGESRGGESEGQESVEGER